jgi:membrane protein implicated in regulation of membrane protease activity
MHERLILALVCLLLALGFLGAIGFVLVTGPVATIDSLLLLSIGGLGLAGFSLLFLSIAHDVGLLSWVRQRLPQFRRHAPASNPTVRAESHEVGDT